MPSTSSSCATCGRPPAPRNTGPLVHHQALTRDVPRSDRRVTTVLFLDVSGFTAMSETLDPEQVTDVINQFFEVLTEPIYRFGGIVDKYMGDAIMALFGAPVAHEDDPERAVRAALEMQKAAETYSDQLEARTGIRLRVRIGINTGLVVAGVVGGAQKKDYTVMGDTVNLAQRMESNAKPGTILVTSETYRLAKAVAEFQELEPLMVKGKRDPVAVYEVVGLKTEQGQNLGTRRMIGREIELETIMRAFERCMDGEPQALYLIGDAGVGKSRLFTEFAARLDPFFGADVQRARAISYEQGTPYGLLASFIRRWLGLRGLAASEITPARLKAWAASVPYLPAEMVNQAAVAVAYLLGLETGNAAFEQLSPQQRRTMAFQAFNTALLSSAQARPMVLDLEDVHWADSPSIEWIQSLFDLLATKPYQASRLLIVCMARPGEGNPIPAWKPRREPIVLELAPLTTSESHELVRLMLEGCDDLDALPEGLLRLIRQVEARGEGNPLFLTELMRSLLDSGAIARDASGAWHVTSVRPPDLPSTVNGVIAARFDRLPDTHRTLLQEASVIGRHFTVSLMSKPAGQAAVEQSLLELAEAEFVRARTAEEYLFYLALTHEVVYNSLLLSMRREMHRRIGERIEAELQNHPPDNPRMLARHFQLGEVPAKALRYLYLSGQQAHRNFANEEAVRCFTECLTLLDVAQKDTGSTTSGGPTRVDVLLPLAEILSTTGHYDAALEHLETVLALQEAPREQAETMRRMGSILNLQGKYAEAMERYEAGLAALARDPDRLCFAKIRQDQGLTLFRQGRYSEVISLCEESLNLLIGTEHLAEVAMAESILGLVAYRQNRHDEAESYHRRALERREAIEDLFGIASSLNNLGVLYREGGEWIKASEHYMRSLTIYRQIGDVSRQIIQLINLSDLYRNQGELKLAYEHYKQVKELSEQTQDSFGQAYGALGLGMVLLDGGQVRDALAELGEGISRLEAINAREVMPDALVAQARCYLLEDRAEDAAAALARARELAHENSSRLQTGMAMGVEALLSLRTGEVDKARRVAAEAVQELRDGGSLIDLGRGLAIEATVLQASGLPKEAGVRRGEAMAIFKRLGATLDLQNLTPVAADS